MGARHGVMQLHIGCRPAGGYSLGMKPSYASTEILELSRALLVKEGGDPTSFPAARAALDSVLGSFHGHLKGLIGDSGFRSLVALSQLRALESQPVLEALLVEEDGSLALVDPEEETAEDVQGQLAEALSALLAEFLVLVRALARDQDWSVADLWPQLSPLKEAGLFPRPEGPGV